MTNQEKKEYLKQINSIDRRIDYLLTAIEREEERCRRLLTVTVNYENDGTQNGSHSNGTEEKVIAYAEIGEYIDSLKDDVKNLYRLKQTIKNIVNNVSNPTSREILFRKYINAEKDESIWISMGYCDRQYWRLHGNALTDINMSVEVSECQ